MGLERVFADEPAFVPYVAAGDPSYEASLEYVEALERGGADVIELGLPFSEPIAEGSTIQGAVVRSLEAGMTPRRYFEFVADLDVEVPLVCMTYYNLVYQFEHPETGEVGPRAFVERAEEAGPLRAACDEFGLDLVFIIAPTTRGDRLESMREQVSGYVYVQARLGTTGARTELSDQTAASLDRLVEYDVPKAVGFGISTGDHAQRVVEAGADGVIVGSALVDIVAKGVERDDPAVTVASRLEGKARELKQGALRGAAAAERSHPERT
jgi:tryptophan synthase alpha chain